MFAFSIEGVCKNYIGVETVVRQRRVAGLSVDLGLISVDIELSLKIYCRYSGVFIGGEKPRCLSLL